MSFPRPRTMKECKKINCKRHAAYTRWDWGDIALGFCVQCKWAHVSQYEPRDYTPTARETK